MATYRISGVWKNSNNVITHYAFHLANPNTNSHNRAVKYSKAEAIAIVEKKENAVTTWVWNYNIGSWIVGENVHVVNGVGGKYLRSNPDSRKTDNLDHLIDFDWIAP